MARLIVKIITAIQLTRLTMAFGAVADVWFVILLTRASGHMPEIRVATMDLWAALAAGAIIAIGLFAYGASLNDVLDVRHDAAFSPDRPIPAGRIRLGQAVVVTIGALIVAVLASTALDTWALWVTLLTAAGILFYNATGKFVPAVGFITIGLVHAAHMLIPNAHLDFMWPVWLVMTHTIVIAAIVHALEDKRPRLTVRALIAVILGWLVWSSIIIAWGIKQGGIWPEGVPAWTVIWPILTVLSFAIVAWWKMSSQTGVAAAEKLKRYGAMWQALYGAGWLAALGFNSEAAWIGGFAVAGFAVMTLIKEVTGLSGKPITYR